MWKQIGVVLAIGGLAVVSVAARRTAIAADNPLQGVWRVMDAQGQPGSGVYIFTEKHYSMMTASTDRPDITDTSQASADELRALWNPMIANSGIYDVEGNLITIHPIVAKIPVVMKPGAFEVYAFAIDGTTLSLTQRRNVRGPVEGRQPTMLVRAE
jgi:hypothetical protein